MERGGERGCPAVRGMANVGAAERGVRDPSDGHYAAACGDLVGEDAALGDLTTRRRAIRGLAARMRRDDVPEQDVVFDAELGQDTMNDRRGRLSRPTAGEKPLGGERDPGDARPPVTRRLADEKNVCFGTSVQIRRQPVTPLGSTPAVPVEVRRLPDPGGDETIDE